ncbi:MAG TPA: hypothetical protein VFN13_02850 [Rudaea sp.]|nr:hypothetical protein [Rudaea sp.]
MKRYFGLILLVLLSHSAFAYSPAAGLWWNPNESGRGYTIDVQMDGEPFSRWAHSGRGGGQRTDPVRWR